MAAKFRTKIFNCRRKKSETVTTWIVFHLNLYLVEHVLCECVYETNGLIIIMCTCTNWTLLVYIVRVARCPKTEGKIVDISNQNRGFWCVNARARLWVNDWANERARMKAKENTLKRKRKNNSIQWNYTLCPCQKNISIVLFFSFFSFAHSLFLLHARTRLISIFLTYTQHTTHIMLCDRALVLRNRKNLYEHF